MRERKPSALTAAILCIALLTLCQMPLAAHELRTGVVVDPATGIVFVAGTEHSIHAVNMQSGEVVWRSHAAQMPLAVVDGRLVAQVEVDEPGRLSLAVLDAANGRLVRQADTPLPEGVHALVDEALGTRFSVRTIALDGAVVVVWKHSFQQITGDWDESAPGQRTASGAVELRFDSGEIHNVETPADPPWPAIEFDAHEQLPRVAGRQFRAAGGGHVLASERQRGEPSHREYLWTLLTADGDELGQAPAPVSYAPFHVADKLVLYVLRPSIDRVAGDWVANPLSLRALSLEDGAEQWVVQIRDTTFYGPFPP